MGLEKKPAPGTQAGGDGGAGTPGPRDIAALLAPTLAGPYAIGYVDEIHGPGSVECEGYRPTVHELRRLARYWAEVRLDVELDYFFYATTGSSAIRRGPYAATRLGRLGEALGGDAVREAVAEVEEEQRRRMGPELWRAFEAGDREARERVAGGHYAEVERLWAKRDDVRVREAALAALRGRPEKVHIDSEGDLWCYTDAYPREEGEPEGRLLLRLTSPGGTSVLVEGCRADRPAGWVPPYGLR